MNRDFTYIKILRIRKLSISVCELKSSIHIHIYGKIKKKTRGFEILFVLLYEEGKRVDKNIDEIYEKYFNRVFFYVKRILKDVGANEDIEDCVSDVFLALWKDSDKYNISRGSYDTYVNVKTRSIALNYRKKLITKQIKVEDIDYNSIPEKDILITENYVIDKFEKQKIIQEIKKFKEPNRSYFYLRYFMNYEIKDIAKIFNTTASAVENKLYRCRLKLKKILKKEVI